MSSPPPAPNAEPKAPRVFYFRHGETLWSLSGQHTGATDIPLTAHGEAQARSLEPVVASLSPTHVFASPRIRAIRTCELAGAAIHPVIEPDLAEWNYGDYEGLRSAEITSIRPGWNIFRDGCPNGESPVQISERADRLIARLREMEGDVALFSHGHFGAVLATRWIGLDVIAGQHFPLSPASTSILSRDPRHADIPVLAQWNSAPAARP